MLTRMCACACVRAGSNAFIRVHCRCDDVYMCAHLCIRVQCMCDYVYMCANLCKNKNVENTRSTCYSGQVAAWRVTRDRGEGRERGRNSYHLNSQSPGRPVALTLERDNCHRKAVAVFLTLAKIYVV